MFLDEDLIPLSALQHLLFCPRQCALIHLEQAWEENRLTAEGKIQHQRADEGGWESRGDRKLVFGLPVRSLRLGLIGKADVVEFHFENEKREGEGIPFPVERKHGRRKTNDCDRVQLCAQALCLEEMLGVPVPEGALFYSAERRREVVPLDSLLRSETEEAAGRLHALLDSGKTPSPEFSPRCNICSLHDLCRPRELGGGDGRVLRYMQRALEEA